MSEPQRDPLTRPEIRWGVGCFLGSASLLGVLTLLIVISFALSPPTWVQVLLGVLLVVGGVAFAWLVASALGQGRSSDRSRNLSGIDGEGHGGSTERRRER